MKRLARLLKTFSFITASGLLVAFLSIIATASVTAATDSTAPGYVDNLKAFPKDGAVQLTWDAATDNVGVTGYKIYMGTETVDEAGESYDLGSLEVANALEYTIPDLENETTYYFALTALDAAGNESESYSFEASATPTGSGDDGKNPVIVSAKATTCDSATVTFSETVVFPEEDPGSAFEIENLDNRLYLKVLEVSYDGADHTSLLLKTETMEEGAQYLMTVGLEIEDNSGNPIVSGTSDTAVFSGEACVEETPADTESTDDDATDDGTDGTADDDDNGTVAPEDETPPHLEEALFNTSEEIQLRFEEAVVLPEYDEATEDNPALAYFKITHDIETIEVFEIAYADEAESDESGTSGDTEAPNDPVDHSLLTLKIAPLKASTEYFVTVTGLADEAGNATDGGVEASATLATPEPEEVPDTIAPEDVTKLMASVVDMLINLSWTASVDSAGDLVDQMVYVSSNGGENYDRGKSLGKDSTVYSFEGGVEGGTYTFRVTTKDEAGNESVGAVVTATLPTTGAGIGLLAAASLAGGRYLGRRKKN